MARTAAKKKQAYHHGDLRRVLLAAALTTIDERGLGALSLHAISKRAGVSSGAPYHHFASREALLVALATEGFARLSASMRDEAAAAPPDPRAQLEAIGRGYIGFAAANRGYFRIMFLAEIHAGEHPELAEAAARAYAILTDAIDVGQRVGAVPPGSPAAYALVAWSAVHGASVLWVDGAFTASGLVSDGDVLARIVSGTLCAVFDDAGAAARRASGGPRPPA